MEMTATIDASGTLDLDLAGTLSRQTYPTAAEAHRAGMATATTLAQQTGEDTVLHLQDPSGTCTLRVTAEGTIPPGTVTPSIAPTEAPADTAAGPLEQTLHSDPGPGVDLGSGGRTGTRSTRRNPFLAEPEVVEEENPIDEDPILGTYPAIRGPQHRTQTPAAAATASLWLVGASGGVGTSTLAGLCSAAIADAGVQQPEEAGRALLVCSTSAASLEAAAHQARASATGQLPYVLVGVVLVHDRPKNRIAKPTLAYARSVARMFPTAMTVPYEPAWREVGATPTPSSTRLKTVLRRIEKIARTGH